MLVHDRMLGLKLLRVNRLGRRRVKGWVERAELDDRHGDSRERSQENRETGRVRTRGWTKADHRCDEDEVW